MAAISAAGFGLSLWMLPVIAIWFGIFATVFVFSLYRFLFMLKDARPDRIALHWNTFASENFQTAAFAAVVSAVPFLIFIIMPLPQSLLVAMIAGSAAASLVGVYYIFGAFLHLLVSGSRKLKLHKRVSRRW
ncbi:MAG: hypothetical protein TR69_WS6001001473 [candidate division WS6 bacterium OLB20]|uniref:Uncharacterized protein n=1 Tax=candidate division WS6 bacterium OLB20 TaxID=1617426 RepID=A0A136LW83_9BACT|nr:MAG: hypothetical protein TR69_WS6001001473 [candidate division WS6 bacterium OLB20]